MIKLRPWVRLPTEWIRSGSLQSFRWNKGEGAAHAAALLVLAPLVHHANDETGETRITYDTISAATGISRSKIAQGLRILQENDIISSHEASRSVYQISGYDKARGWAKFPAKCMYHNGKMFAFDDFRFRNLHELNALKLYYFLIERRDNERNLAKISYDKISEYTAIERHRIKSALSILAVNGLVHVERVPSDVSSYGSANAYRIVGIDQYQHMGTIGRSIDQNSFSDVI